MTQIRLDATFSKQLLGLARIVELCDPDGKLLGRFLPTSDISEWEPLSPDVSEEELDRREQETDSFTTDEVLAHLENLP